MYKMTKNSGVSYMMKGRVSILYLELWYLACVDTRLFIV